MKRLRRDTNPDVSMPPWFNPKSTKADYEANRLAHHRAMHDLFDNHERFANMEAKRTGAEMLLRGHSDAGMPWAAQWHIRNRKLLDLLAAMASYGDAERRRMTLAMDYRINRLLMRSLTCIDPQEV